MSRLPLMLCSLTLTCGLGTAVPLLPAPSGADSGVAATDSGTVGDGGNTVTDAAGVDGAQQVVDAGPLVFSPDASGVVGPAGGRITGLAQSQDAQFVYAVGDQRGGLFRSSTQGTAFAPLALPQALTSPVVGASYGSTDVVLVADALGQGAWVHTQRGEDPALWTAVATLASVSVQRFVSSPAVPGRVYALVHGVGTPTADGGAALGGLWMSDDNGLTFAAVGLSSETVHDVLWNGSAHVAATDRGVIRLSPGGSVLTLSSVAVNSVVADPSMASTYLAANAVGQVFRVVGLPDTNPIQDLALPMADGALISHGATVYALAGSTVYRSVTPAPSDAGPGVLQGFQAEATVGSNARLTGGVSLLAASPGLVLSTAGAGVISYSITATGLSPRSPATGLTAHRCPGLHVDPDLVLVGCVAEGESSSVARIWSGPSLGVAAPLDLGTGEVVPTPGGPVAVSRGPDGTAYAAVGALYRSNGAGWTATGVGSVFSVDAQPASGSSVLVLGVRRSDGIPQVQLSTDKGATSNAVPGTLGVMPWQVAFSRVDALHALLVALPELPWTAFTPLNLERGVFETVDAFSTLVHAGPALVGDSVVAVVQPAADPQQSLVVTLNGRFFRRATLAGTWDAGGMVSGLTVMSMAEVPGRTGALVVAGIPAVAGGAALQLSVDDGATWTPLDAVHVPPALRVVADPAGGDRLLVGTVGQGIWVVRP